jgi:hypothetical protein
MAVPTTRPFPALGPSAGRMIRTGCYALLSLAAMQVAAAEPGVSEQALVPPTHARGATLFATLPPAETGIVTENKFADPKMKGELYQEFETSSIGTGVAIGDYDGDGRPDVFVVSKTESCRLFRNLGNWHFEDVTDKAGVGDHGADAMIWKQGATFVDVNNDGRLDIYVCRTRAPNLLYINQGDGTFKESAHAYGLDINDSSVMAAFCDYDRDGWLDVYITTNIVSIMSHPNGQRGFLLHNNGNGTFTDVTDKGGIYSETQSHSATWWDFDNDGWPDLYVANDYGAPDKLYRNNRNGTFTDVLDRVLPHTAFSSMGADIGDVNNDGLIDFLVADMAATTHKVDHHSLADARGRTEERPMDLTTAPKYHRNALLLNTGTGHCLEAGFLSNLAATDWTWSPRFEDLDDDGRVDLFVTNGFPRDPGVDVVRKMMGAESPRERIRIMYASPAQTENKIAMRNLGDLQFESVGHAWGLDEKGVSFGTAFGDLDGDGDLDMVYANFHAGVATLRNDSDRGHRIMIDLRGTVSNRFGIGATVRIESQLGIQASQLVLARGYMSSSEPAFHFGLGADTVIKRMIVTWPSGHVQTFENLPVDRRFTITEPAGPAPIQSAKPAAPAQFVETGTASGLALKTREEAVDEVALQKLLPAKLSHRGPALAVGRIDADDREDLVVGGTTLDPLRILRSSAPGQYAVLPTTGVTTTTDVDDGPILLLDANSDGSLDLLVTKGGNSFPAGSPELQPKLFLNDGAGHFTPAAENALPPYTASVGAVAAADVDRDGRLDVFVGGRVLTGQYPEAPQSALWLNRGGTYEDVTDTFAPALRSVGMVTDALWSDLDNDGWPDLLLTLEWGEVKVFHNRQGQGLEDWTRQTGFAAAGTGWWTAIAAADFNGDGRLDYVVGNAGLNTQYHADRAHPAVLFSGDFKGDGSSQLIEGYYEGDRLYPWRTRRDMGAAMPWILKKYPWADDYAGLTLGDIFGADKLAAAQRYEATELRNGVFLSQADGTYRFEPLPRLAQISTIQGLVTGDFDGDGFADIYAVQNSYAPIPAVGRFDGGLSQLLRGDGHGHFTPATPAESGLIVPGDAKAAALLDQDQDGWPDFVVTQNNSTTLAFRNGGVRQRHSLALQLRGPAGNPTAVGARVTVDRADGSTLVAEVYAGSGHYSQSGGTVFVGYPDGAAPRKLHVRWPSGQTTDHDVPPGVPTLTLTAP